MPVWEQKQRWVNKTDKTRKIKEKYRIIIILGKGDWKAKNSAKTTNNKKQTNIKIEIYFVFVPTLPTNKHKLYFKARVLRFSENKHHHQLKSACHLRNIFFPQSKNKATFSILEFLLVFQIILVQLLFSCHPGSVKKRGISTPQYTSATLQHRGHIILSVKRKTS